MKRRLEFFRRLSESLVRSRNAIVHLDLAALLETTTEQESLCSELRQQQVSMVRGGFSVIAGRGSAGSVLSFTGAGAELEAASALSRELAKAQSDVRIAARINGALLQRCARTAACLRNLYLRYSGTYANPGSPSAAGANRR
jgi:hypothetical protein